MIHPFNRWDAVPTDHLVLMKVDCFGEMGGPLYKDSIVVHAPTREELEEYCKVRKFTLKDPNGWNEYFIIGHPNANQANEDKSVC